MSVIPLTISFSLGLVAIFVALFWREHHRSRFASAERDSLLPLAEESSRLAGRARGQPADPARAREPGAAGATDGARPTPD